jgi:cytochrome c-type biogenesis protein CcmH/NrfG
VDEVMRAGEAAFTRGDMQGALSAYQQALLLDPKVYDAALFSGDVCFRLDQVEKSYEWYARAAQIDPDQETAYRYWGDALIRGWKKRDKSTSKQSSPNLTDKARGSP